MTKYKESKIISGEEAFTLYDTFGFPIDLSELIARENSYTIDLKSFEIELGKQKERSRNVASSEEGDWIEVRPYSVTEFVGYDKNEEQVSLVKYRSLKTKNKDYYQLVFDKSPFYAESGGQVGDTGYIESPAGEKIFITNTIKENNLSIHMADKLPADPMALFTARIDLTRRQSIANNHSATHLLHKALREILGNHIEQKGSLVNFNYFRFDFSHYEKVSDQNFRAVEKRVNQLIRENTPLDEFREMPVGKAKALGAMALFGEKYGDNVRVIKFGDSIELCGGTHTSATGNIGLFKIVSESAIAAGVRRIEATTGEFAGHIVEGMEDTLRAVKEILNNAPNVVSSIQKLMEENDNFRKTIEEAMKEKAVALKGTLLKNTQVINGINIVVLKGEHPADFVRNIAFLIRNDARNTAFIAGCTFEGKVHLALLYSDDLVAKGKDASKEIREASAYINGGGGGQNFFASAGGKNPDGITAAIAKLTEQATN